MHLGIDHAGQDMQPGRVERFGGGGGCQVADCDEAPAANANIGLGVC
jgi:hypothetical protein